MRLACFGLLAAVRWWRRENNATIDFFDAACAAKFGMWCPDGLRLSYDIAPGRRAAWAFAIAPFASQQALGFIFVQPDGFWSR